MLAYFSPHEAKIIKKLLKTLWLPQLLNVQVFKNMQIACCLYYQETFSLASEQWFKGSKLCQILSRARCTRCSCWCVRRSHPHIWPALIINKSSQDSTNQDRYSVSKIHLFNSLYHKQYNSTRAYNIRCFHWKWKIIVVTKT